jgi:hypothetical protein
MGNEKFFEFEKLKQQSLAVCGRFLFRAPSGKLNSAIRPFALGRWAAKLMNARTLQEVNACRPMVMLEPKVVAPARPSA